MEEILKPTKNATTIMGVFLLAVIVAYGVGNGFIMSVLDKPDYLSSVYAAKMQMITGAFLMLLNSVMVTAIGFRFLANN